MDSQIDALERLFQLHERGALTLRAAVSGSAWRTVHISQ